MFMVDKGKDTPHHETLTTAQAVGILGVTRAAIHKWRAAGKLKPVQAKGRIVLWDRQAILNLFKSRVTTRAEVLEREIRRLRWRLNQLQSELKASQQGDAAYRPTLTGPDSPIQATLWGEPTVKKIGKNAGFPPVSVIRPKKRKRGVSLI